MGNVTISHFRSPISDPPFPIPHLPSGRHFSSGLPTSRERERMSRIATGSLRMLGDDSNAEIVMESCAGCSLESVITTSR